MRKYSFRDAAACAAWLGLAGLALGLQWSLGAPAPAVAGQAQTLASHALLVEDAYIELEGVSAPGHEQVCAMSNGDQIAASRLARQRLGAILDAQAIDCAPSLGHVGEARLAASCRTSEGDVAAAMVAEGWLAASSSVGAYARLERDARAQRRGMWAPACEVSRS